jgi:hypothetical protein
MIAALQALHDALEAESAALEQGALRQAGELSRAKVAALEGFVAARAALSPAEASAQAPRLMLPMERLRLAVARNREALERGIAIQSRVVELIARAARPPAAPGYAKPARNEGAAIAFSLRA